MPTYDYECKSCGEFLKIEQSITEEARTMHIHGRGAVPGAACSGPIKRVILQAPGISKKGSGWTPRFHG